MIVYFFLHLSDVAAFVITLLHFAGLFSVFHAIVKVRTPQGAVAWSLFLILLPEVGVLLYWAFGRNKFHGYVEALRAHKEDEKEVIKTLTSFKEPEQFFCNTGSDVYEKIARMPFTSSNDIKLLVDGDATFSAIFEAIDRADEYILLEFFIVKDDDLGRELKQHLLAKAHCGIPVYFLYDEIGSNSLPRHYIREMRTAGIKMEPFNTRQGWLNKFQINFRNHRKIVVVDGKEAFVGGLNVGDEYMGRDPKFGHWRDTHSHMHGPCVQAVQMDWWSDWFWSTRTVTEELRWEPVPAENSDKKILVVGSGPDDKLDNCELFFINSINRAQSRIWIASPYYIPDNSVIKALQLAALRGVDVRIMLPNIADHKTVWLAGYTYLPADDSGVKIYRYTNGFLHQKVMLIDDDMASVGTANMDNRSFRLNFEISILVNNRSFARDVETMFLQDFEQCERCWTEDYNRRSWFFRFATKAAALVSPIL